MRRRLDTLGQRSALFVTSFVFLSAFAGAAPANAQAPEVQSSDRSFLVSLRQTNSWLVPISREIPARTTNTAVGNAGRDIFEAHSRLDVELLKSANDLGVVLPNDVSSEHQSVINEMAERSGNDHDRAYATITRRAQGTLLVTATRTRAVTLDATIRALAHQTVQMLARTMTVLEDTGLADPSAFDLAAAKAQVNSVRVAGRNAEPSERELLVLLAQHSLWQQPAGRESAGRGRDAQVRRVAGQLAAEQAQLAQEVGEAARQLGVDLPAEPTAEQRSWVNAISSSSGDVLDDRFANLSRAAGGTVVVEAALTRAATRSAPVRAAAQTGLNLLVKHIQLLEGTGLVRSDSLQLTAAAAAPRPVSSPARLEESPVNVAALAGIAVLLVAVAGSLWFVRVGGQRH
ncbi:protein of unknown function [Lentzea fradiae]|uniref:DUF4142 domain-containing protein n=1 Tax=Lentzea fradiae TaxID=200378 RepID=A0A1G7ZUE6_9PSEU|nr:DUF4142 domain-containing protein [Lentzea fradiae]SDH12311.1 protein of unknown function [Lentzea fradiae]